MSSKVDDLPLVTDLQRIIIDNLPLLDLRAPLEFAAGTIPGAVNLPLIDDAERHQIGLCYAEQGQDAAITLGHQLVCDDKKTARVAAWQAFAAEHPQGVLFCWRGGMRSKISQQWLFEATGLRYPRIDGGYKALRQYLLSATQEIANNQPLLILAGRTGVGKTRFLHSQIQQIDLEGLANHRGSAFGPHATAQPNQIHFENALAQALIRRTAAKPAYLLIEDEGRNIGARTTPEPLYQQMNQSPLLLLEATLEERQQLTYQEYIVDALAEYQQLLGEESGFNGWADYLRQSLHKIRKRLGGERHLQLQKLLESALQQHWQDPEAHLQWIQVLLQDYYDPMYDYQIGKKEQRIVMRGNAQQLSEWLQDYAASK
ncbi:MAG: tRNA 2-selenouridine(34) synthase MnmH [Gammaproteobacteria bacterium]|nr:tRNA 2-selenouridine(34) synthase MnmH [Gammaproteobacteria bacterium]